MKIDLPFTERDAYDTSILQTSQRCPRKAEYHYFLNRAPAGRNVPIGFGLAYHKFREVLEKNYITLVRDGDEDLASVAQGLYHTALNAALEGYKDPPLEHSKSYLTRGRLELTCEQGFQLWMSEKRRGRVKVLEAEQAFELKLPDGHLFTGRFDQIVDDRGKIYLRDFKTTSRMGRNYSKQFTPNDQMTGYTWAARQLSGRKVVGVIIQVVYNTKTKGPEHHTFLSARTDFHIQEWLKNIQMEMSLLDSYVEDRYFPMRTTACGDFGGCYFRDCCSMSSPAMREAWLRSHTIESVWDPRNPDDEEGYTD